MHEDIMNFLLSHACGRLTDDELKCNGGKQEFAISLHCREYVVVAKALGNLKYKVLGVYPSE